MKKCFSKIISAVIITALLLAAAACTPKVAITGNTTIDPNAGVIKAVSYYKATLSAQKISKFPDEFVTGINSYGWNVASGLYSGENLALSPASLELALLMTRTGAAGATADEMKAALSMSALSDEDILPSCKQLMWRANTNGMEAANSIWMQKDYSFRDTFISSCTNNFMTDAFTVDFQNDPSGATDSINKWASDKTNGKIPSMNPKPLDTYTQLVLVNALSFLGAWETPFNIENSYSQVFHGTQKDSSVLFMHDKREMLYAQTKSYQMISLPFTGDSAKSDSPYSMAFILPADGQNLTSLMNNLAATGFTSAVSGLAGAKVQLTLPKYEFTFDASMKETMQALGMNLAFDPDKADFSGMTDSDNRPCISDILHNCYIRVDENGTEADAETEPMMTTASASLDNDLKTFTADRPFLFAIYDETDNTILFLGVVGQL